MTNKISILALINFALCLVGTSNAQEFRFASMYQSHMVLQRAPSKAKLWGYAEADASISLNFLGKQYSTIVTKSVDFPTSYVWKIILDPVEANNKPSTIHVFQTTPDGVVSKISLTDVLFGDVWLCGGQSNMEWNLYNAFNGSNEINNAADYTAIRIFQATRSNNSKPLNEILDITTRWSKPSKPNLQKFSAVCWFYGKQLYKQLNIPIGLVQSCYGGTNIEKWLSPEPISFCGVKKSFTNSIHWNSMIKPFHSLSIYGIVWYQGETNRVFNLHLYNCTFPALVNDWRNKWFIGTDGSTDPQFPFGFVQVANYADNLTIGGLPWLRFHQTADFGYAPNPILKNVFMASAVDLVDNYENPTHPRYKEDVGKRLSLGAFNLAYHIPVEYAPPNVIKIENFGIKHAGVVVKYDIDRLNFSSKMVQKSKSGFEVCCDVTNCLLDQENNWQSLDYTGFNAYDRSLAFAFAQTCYKPMYVRYLWRNKPCEYKSCPWYWHTESDQDLPFLPFIKEVLVL